MVSLERMLFDVNEALHHMEVIPAEHYITAATLAYSVLLTFAMVPIMLKILEWIANKDRDGKYTSRVVISLSFGTLVVMGAYEAIAFVIFLIFVVDLIYSDAKYYEIRNFIDKLF